MHKLLILEDATPNYLAYALRFHFAFHTVDSHKNTTQIRIVVKHVCNLDIVFPSVKHQTNANMNMNTKDW